MSAQRTPPESLFNDSGEENASPFKQWIGPVKARPKVVTDAAIARATEEAREMMRAGDFTHARPVHFVAIYVRQHERVYGVAPARAELSPEQRLTACRLVSTLIRSEFGDDLNAFADFMRWVWMREQKRWTPERRRIAWGTMFRASFLLTDYRIAVAQQRRTG